MKTIVQPKEGRGMDDWSPLATILIFSEFSEA